MKFTLTGSIVVVGTALLSTACAGGSGGGSAKTGEPLNIPRCGPEGLIEDGEDGDNKVLEQDGRAGYWYTAIDNDGTTVEPQAGAMGGTFAMRAGGSNGSGFAACMKGTVAEGGASPFAVMGMNFVDPKGPYDATKYGGVAFWAKKGKDTESKVRLKIPDVNTDPEGGVCQACFNDFGMDLELTEDWTEYVLMWPDAKQLPYWGNPRPDAISADKLYGLQWQVNKRTATFDVCVDDIAFVGCGG